MKIYALIGIGLIICFLSGSTVLAQAHYEKAEALVKAGKYVEAIAEYQLEIDDHPDEAIIYAQRGLAQTLAGQANPAIESYQQAIELDPKLWEPRFNLGMILYQEDRPAEALPHFLEAQRLQPKMFQTNFLVARIYQRQGQAAEAESNYRIAAQFAASDSEKSEVQISLAELQLQKQDYPAAEQSLIEARGYQGDAEKINELLVRLYSETKQKEKALELLKNLAAPNSGGGKWYEPLAQLQLEQKQYDEAAKSFAMARQFEHDPKHRQELLLAEVQATEDAGKVSEAIALLKDMVATSRDSHLHFHLGTLLMKQRIYSQAATEFVNALELDLSCVECLSNLGGAFIMDEKWQPAIQALTRFSRAMPELAGTYFFLALAYEHLDDVENAKLNYRKFLDLDQGKNDVQDFQARQRLKALEKRKGKR